jgi:hypothetical protein
MLTSSGNHTLIHEQTFRSMNQQRVVQTEYLWLLKRHDMPLVAMRTLLPVPIVANKALPPAITALVLAIAPPARSFPAAAPPVSPVAPPIAAPATAPRMIILLFPFVFFEFLHFLKRNIKQAFRTIEISCSKFNVANEKGISYRKIIIFCFGGF